MFQACHFCLAKGRNFKCVNSKTQYFLLMGSISFSSPRQAINKNSKDIKRCLETSQDTSESQASSELLSCLANHLLVLCGRGDMFATALQKLARATVLDSCSQKELLQFASLGAFWPASC